MYLPLFARKEFLGANLCLLLFTCAYSSSVFWAILLQNVMGYSSVATGLFYLPVTLPVMFMAPLGGMLRDKYGPRLPTMAGAIMVTMGAFWIAFSTFKGNYLAMLPGFLLFGLGPSLIYSSAMATAVSSVPWSQMGMATGISNGVRQLGRVLGVAMIGLVISNIERYHLISAFTNAPEKIKQLSTQQLMSLLSGSTSAKNTLSVFSHVEISNIYGILKSSYAFAFSMGMITAGILVILTFVASFLLPNKVLCISPANSKNSNMSKLQ